MEKVIGIIAGILTSISMMPQLIKLYKEKKCEDVSLLMIIVLIAGVMGWTIYGILKNDITIIITNAFSFLVNSVILILTLRFKKHHTTNNSVK